MPKQTPITEPLPSAGGSYLLDPATGAWVLQQQTVEPSVIPETDGINSEAPALGEG